MMDETGEIAPDKDAKDEFSVEVAQAWEQALAAAPTPATRKVPLRLSMVFGVGTWVLCFRSCGGWSDWD